MSPDLYLSTTRSIVHLLSGGLDSTVLLHDLRRTHRVHCLMFDYGQTHRRELKFGWKHCYGVGVPFNTFELPTKLRGSKLTGDGNDWVVPFRNPILLGFAINFAAATDADCVTIGCNADDAAMFPDCHPAFVEAFQRVIDVVGVKVQLVTPYIHMSKGEIVRIGQQLGVNLGQTWSCYSGGETPCGECDACQKRKAALA